MTGSKLSEQKGEDRSMILIWEIQAAKSIMDPVAAAKPIEGRHSELQSAAHGWPGTKNPALEDRQPQPQPLLALLRRRNANCCRRNGDANRHGEEKKSGIT